jgi:hypothetical protein
VLEYLAHTKDFAICYDGNAQDDLQLFVPSSDASFASDPDTRQSHQGYLFSLYDGPIDWKAGKQRSVTTSSTEAELLALSATAKQSIWWSRAFTAIGYSPGHETRIQCDNAQTIRLVKETSAKLATKLRHVDIHNHWLRQEVQKGVIKLQWSPSAETLADGLTKALPKQKHQLFLQHLNLIKLPDI